MASLIILATVMALFGVLGYQRGTRPMLFTTLVLLLGLTALTRGVRMIATLVNGLNFAVRFVLAGGLQALSASDRSAALDAAITRVGSVTPLITVNDAGTATGPGMMIMLVLVILVAFLLGALKILRPRRSILGLFLGLLNGYILTAFLLRVLLPDAPLQLGLPGWLFGASFAVPSPIIAATGPSFFDVLWARILNTLNTLAEQGTLGLVVAVLIALFVLLATRLGNRSEKRG